MCEGYKVHWFQIESMQYIFSITEDWEVVAINWLLTPNALIKDKIDNE